jgi:hypothetical protein
MNYLWDRKRISEKIYRYDIIEKISNIENIGKCKIFSIRYFRYISRLIIWLWTNEFVNKVQKELNKEKYCCCAWEHCKWYIQSVYWFYKHSIVNILNI